MDLNYDSIFQEYKQVRKIIKVRGEVESAHSNSNSKMFHVTSTYQNNEAMPIYLYLDKLIDECKLNKKNQEILRLIQMGHTLKSTADIVHVDSSNVSKRLNTICKSIVKEHNLLKSIDKARQEKEYFKACTICRKQLPMTKEFYAFDKTNFSYKSACKKCRKG